VKEILCPNCQEKLQVDEDKKYADCYHCGHEFKLSKEGSSFEKTSATASIFGKFMQDKGLNSEK